MDDTDAIVLDLIEGTLSGPQWDVWLAEHPSAAAEVAIGRRVRSLLVELRSSSLALSADFEARLLQRVRTDRTLLDLLELLLSGAGRAIVELLNCVLTVVSGQPESAVS